VVTTDTGYARKLTDDLSVGATARFIRSDMSGLDKDDVANAVAFDLGLYYRRNFENWEQSGQFAQPGSKAITDLGFLGGKNTLGCITVY